ncbi:formimidoylglutamase [Terasakiella sp. A23]|uniref:formimidoylglutamase n=1 Tax=Terasakiella sp. FCG-A23 TaxID=3080561 RepID=UPI0029537078|nr:formimidoylglutamase [Terasakiella sp. A23]MDV7341502.1 formimidoylglutamase [Terasakiella sp. A23]
MAETFKWTGRQDPEDGPNAKRWHQIVTSEKSNNCIASLIGFACDLGVENNKGRIGAKAGPDAIRGALANMAWHRDAATVCDYGNIEVSTHLEEAQDDLAQQVEQALAQTAKTIVLGGGHETAAGSFKGLLKHLANKSDQTIGIINLDAHFDLRKPGEKGVSSGTPFYQIHQMLMERGQEMKYLCLGIAETSNTSALFERCRKWNVQYMLDYDIGIHQMEEIKLKIDSFLKDCDYLYLTIDLDVLPHWQMPAVSAPASYGVELGVLEKIIDHLASLEINWPLSDIVEFNPELDINSHGARVAARLVNKTTLAMTAK